jgi:thioredoxin-like negative regulator of GroEL
MSAPTAPAAPATTTLDDVETHVSRFLREQIARMEAASAKPASPAMQNAAFAAMMEDFAHQLAGALGALASYYHDPEAALGRLLTTAVASMQEQRDQTRLKVD